LRNWNIDAFLTDSIDSVALDRNTVAPTGNLFGAVYGIAFDDGLEVDGVVHVDAVKAKVVDMYCVVKGTFEDYGLRGGASGAAHH
jgi:hypothetical protein